ncbi:hypothetical protein JL720_11927 [Aureococcus anophagefferens]|nr:hypothetical protein JL720_11927 [Aureococcus anophagefferens]
MAAHPCVLARLREAAPRGSTVTAIAASRLGVACAFASRSQVPEVVVWVGSEPVAAGAGDLHAVTVVALGDRGGAPVCCFAPRSTRAPRRRRALPTAETALSFFAPPPRGGFPADSPLRADVAAPPPKDRTLLSYDTLHKTKRKPGMDMPITFHAKVRSSGYGPGPGTRRSKPPARRRDDAPDYPVDCGPLDAHQPQRGAAHDYALPTSAALLGVEFSSDARCVVAASSGGAPVALRLPVAKHRGSDAAATALGLGGRPTHASFSHDGKWVVRSGHEGAPPEVFANHRKRAVEAPTLALKAGGAGARFYYLDRFLLAPRTRDGRAELALFAVGLDEGRAGPGDGAARRVHAFGHGDAKRLDAVACLNGAYSPLIVTATSDRRVSVLDAAAGRRARVIDDAHARPAHDVAAPGPPAPGVARSTCDVFATAATRAGKECDMSNFKARDGVLRRKLRFTCA